MEDYHRLSGFLAMLAVAVAGCSSGLSTGTLTNRSTRATIEIPAPSVRVTAALHQDLDLHEISKHADDDTFIPVLSISGSGLGTYQGAEVPPVHLVSIVTESPQRTMRLYLRLASTDGFINRSQSLWVGDHIAGVRAAGRMYDRDMGGKGKIGKMAGVVHLKVPGQNQYCIMLFSYDATGKLIPYFGKRPFADYVKRISASESTANQ